MTQTQYRKSTFSVPKMDCASEENLVRLALGEVSGIRSLRFNLPDRSFEAIHSGPTEELSRRLLPLGLGAALARSECIEEPEPTPVGQSSETRMLWVVLLINAVMFVVELVVGVLGGSTGLIADSLDMLADASTYAVSLFAVSRGYQARRRAAHFGGWLQLLLALAALAEVVRHVVYGIEPMSAVMIGMGFVALLANVTTLVLLAKRKESGAHIKASYICTSNDVIANAGVILAGGLVAWTGSGTPDLLIGTIVALLVLNGARRMLAL